MHTDNELDDYPIVYTLLMVAASFAILGGLGFWAGYVTHSYSDDCRPIVISGEGVEL